MKVWMVYEAGCNDGSDLGRLRGIFSTEEKANESEAQLRKNERWVGGGEIIEVEVDEIVKIWL